MHIIGGKLKGKKLAKCNLKFIRPAMALTRKSIFDTLQDSVEGANVLDLFAGSGIIGIECLSRGAKSLTLIDSDKRSLSLIRKNLSLCNLNAKIILGKLPNILNKKKLSNEEFDLIFIDPPYGSSDFISDVLDSILKNNLLSESGIILIESEEKSCFSIPEGLILYKERVFGNTKMTYLNL